MVVARHEKAEARNAPCSVLCDAPDAHNVAVLQAHLRREGREGRGTDDGSLGEGSAPPHGSAAAPPLSSGLVCRGVPREDCAELRDSNEGEESEGPEILDGDEGEGREGRAEILDGDEGRERGAALRSLMATKGRGARAALSSLTAMCMLRSVLS